MFKTAAFIGLGLCILVLSGCAPRIDGSSAKASTSTNLKDEREITRLNAEIKLMKSKLAQADKPDIKKKSVSEKVSMTKKGLVTSPKKKRVNKSDSSFLVTQQRTGTDFSSSQSFTTPESWKKIRMPEPAPSIFDQKHEGTMEDVSAGMNKLDTADDSTFMNIYNSTVAKIQHAYLNNVETLSSSEKTDHEVKMQVLKDRYYKLLYKD